ncbi:MAG: hypothetical protein ChlgKO_13440 [Chlamydiales bacterium]
MEILQEELDELKLSFEEFASKVGLSLAEIKHLLNRKGSLTERSAIKFGCFFGTTVKFWLNLQKTYDEKITSRCL